MPSFTRLDPDSDLNPDPDQNLFLILNLILILQERKKANEVDRMVLVGDAKVCEYYPA